MIAVNSMAGAIGSALVSRLWPVGGWHAVTTAGIVVSIVGLLLWSIGRHGALGSTTAINSGGAARTVGSVKPRATEEEGATPS
jgi:hypothetical protein